MTALTALLRCMSAARKAQHPNGKNQVITRKMLLMGAMFMTLLNVSTVGVWANPSTGKVVASAKRATGTTRPSLTRVAFFAAPSSDADSGCSTTASISDVDQPLVEQPNDPIPGGNPFGPQLPPKTPCELAKEDTARAQKVANSNLAEAKAANDRYTDAQNQSDNAAQNPQATEEEKTRLAGVAKRALDFFNNMAIISAVSDLALKEAQVAEAEACAVKPKPKPQNPGLEVEEQVDHLFGLDQSSIKDSAKISSGAFS